MELDDETIEEFRKVYQEEFTEELTLEEARVMATKLLSLYLALAKKLPDARECKNENNQVA